MTDLPKQKSLIKEKDWNCLIVLDACRFDYFQRFFNDYLDGNLIKSISEGSHTPEWLKKTFKNGDYSDVCYVSANPYINSKGIDLIGFNGKDYFYKIIDLWDKEWDEDLKTVPPQHVSKVTRMMRAKHPDKRIISHFMQPHFPYFSINFRDGFFSSNVKQAKKGESWIDYGGNLKGIIKDYVDELGLREFFANFLGPSLFSKLTLSLNLRNLNPLEQVKERYGLKTLRKGYVENLLSAFSEIKSVVNRLPGEIAITADHGELLGENGLYEHPHWYNGSVIREVPWLRVKRSN